MSVMELETVLRLASRLVVESAEASEVGVGGGVGAIIGPGVGGNSWAWCGWWSRGRCRHQCRTPSGRNCRF